MFRKDIHTNTYVMLNCGEICVCQHSQMTLHCSPLTSKILQCCSLRILYRETVSFWDVMWPKATNEIAY